jgi:hypothetical protein
LHESQTLEVGREKTSGSYIGFPDEDEEKERLCDIGLFLSIVQVRGGPYSRRPNNSNT